MDRLILARHAESVFNVRGVLNGDPSVPGGLTERGRAQARELGDAVADEPIDLCVTTEFARTVETADLTLAGRAVPRLVMRELNDPPAGELELHPYEELARWRETNGPDVAIPGLTRTERDYFRDAARGFRRLVDRPEGSVLAILHGYVITWITSVDGSSSPARHAEPIVMERAQLIEVLDAVADDVFAHYSWETSGRPLLGGPSSMDL